MNSLRCVLLGSGLNLPPVDGAVFLFVLAIGLLLIKVTGYYVLAVWLVPRYPEVEIAPMVFAVARALLGVVVGLAYHVGTSRQPGWTLSVAWYVPLLFLRLGEWVVIMWLFFGRHVGRRAVRQVAAHVLVGTATSAALDLVVVLWLIPSFMASIAVHLGA